MAPPKAATPKKGKAPMKAGQPAAASRSTAPEGALRGSRITSAGIDKVRHLAAAKTNEHGATSMKPAGSSKLREGCYPIFLHTLSAGLVPPFSDFLDAILEAYQIQLLHLHPNSILILSIFAYLCEAYIGIRPSVELFRSFYALRSTALNECTGCVSFRIAQSSHQIRMQHKFSTECD